MTRQFFSPLDLNQNELRNAVFHILPTAPLNPFEGQFYYNSTVKKAYIFNDNDWLDITVALIAATEGDFQQYEGGQWVAKTADEAGLQTFHGFVVPYEVTLTYNGATRTFTLTPTGASFDVWILGKKYTKVGVQTYTHSNTSGDHFIYYNASGVLEESVSPWDFKAVAPVGYAYYNTTLGDGYALFELHTFKRNLEWHESQHFAIGTFLRSGLVMSGYTLATDTNAAITPLFTSGVIVDEDIEYSIPQVNDGGPYTIVRRSGASEYTWTTTNTVPFLYGTYLQYNQNVGGNWQMTDGVTGDYINYYVFATTALDVNKRIYIVPSQTKYATLADAQAESVASLDVGSFSLTEFTPLYKIVFRLGAGYTSTGKARIESVDRLSNVKGSVNINLAGAIHNALSGRSDADSHPISAITGLQTALDAKFPAAGGTLTGRMLVNNLGNIVYENDNGVYIPRPQNATYRTTTPSVTGALAIQLPTPLYSTGSDMVSFWVDIYDYGSNESLSLYVFGYLYGSSTGQWANVGAVNLTSNTTKDYTVRFCHDGTRHVVCIGEIGSTWDYPQVTVRDFQAGFTAVANNSDDGWNITFLTILPTVMSTATGNLVVAKSAASATTAATATNVAWSGITSKPTTLSGFGITDSELRQINGIPRSNLGDPTVREMAVFDAQFGNKTDRTDIANILFETSTDGITWSTINFTDSDKRRFVGGDLNLASGIYIPNGTAYFRVKFRAAISPTLPSGYAYLNALYSYFSTNGNTTEVTIYKKHDSGSLEQHTNSTASVTSWPGHLYVPFVTLPFRTTAVLGTHYHEVYAVFKPTWINANNITLYNMSWWGGYPAGRRNLYSTDEFGVAAFPTDVTGVTAALGDSSTKFATTAFVNAEIANDAPSKAGLGATGTWGISITGNAATLTNFTVTTSTPIASENTVSAIAYVNGLTLFGQSDGALYSHFYSASWKHQIFGDYRTGQLAVRGKNNGTWQAWRTVLDSTNYTDYTVTKTGTGASGTWGISITGSAAGVPWAGVTGTPTTLSGYGITDAVNTSLLGANNGVATLGADGKVPSGQLPSYVDDVLEYANVAAFPGTGETSKIYVALDTNKIYRWTGTVYTEISPSAGNADTATKLLTARTIAMTGDVDWSVSFDGSGNVTAAGTLANTGISAGSYQSATEIRSLTFDAKGRCTGIGAAVTIAPAFSSVTGKPTTLSGYGITDAYTKTESDANYPTKTGSGASGTWGIDVSGNAATVSSITSGQVTTALGFSPQEELTLTTTGTSGPATLIGATLNIPQYDAGGTEPPNACQVDVFTASGTYTKPAGAKAAEVIVIGGGGGGGSGRKGAINTNRGGGGYGGSGARSILTINLTDVTTIAVTVGAGGAGGASQTTNSTNGNNGTIGGQSHFGDLITASGGGRGTGGSTSGATNGQGGFGNFSMGQPDPSPSQKGVTWVYASSAGGYGGSYSNNNIVTNPSAVSEVRGSVAPTAATTDGQNGGNGNGIGSPLYLGTGGGGGYPGITGSGGNGGNGGGWGAGGGGGGGCTNDLGNSGAGGNGSDGIVIVFTYF